MTSKPDECPECGSTKVASILYGLPSFDEELEQQLNAEEVVLGGCTIFEGENFANSSVNHLMQIQNPRRPIEEKRICTSRAAATVVDSSDRLGRAAALLMQLDLGHAWLLASGLGRNAVRHLMTEKA